MSNLAIYKPRGKAAEYSEYACNFYVGCTGACSYCYLKKGRGAKVLGGDIPVLKKCFKSENHALEVFRKELDANRNELLKYGLFFSFTTDPMLPETSELTWRAIMDCNDLGVPVKVLTKRAEWVEDYVHFINHSNSENEDREWRELIAFGFTLTGHDELEPGASTNYERIAAMKLLHEAGFKTFASIEPIIYFNSSFSMIAMTLDYCDLYKIGLLSGGKYDKNELQHFVNKLKCLPDNPKIYLKESIRKKLCYDPLAWGLGENFVEADYNMFKQQKP